MRNKAKNIAPNNFQLSLFQTADPVAAALKNSIKTLDINSGKTISFYNNTQQDIRTWVFTNPAEIESDFTSFFVYNSWPSSGKFFPILIEIKNDTIIDSFEFDKNKIIEIPNLSIDELRNEAVYGPFTNDHLSYTFLVQYEIIGQSPKSFLWKTDKNSNVLEQKYRRIEQ